MLQQVETINKDTRIIKKNRMEILELETTITEMKNSLNEFNSRLEMAEESVSIKLEQ